eukprot:scaffold27876_cov58-Phaeocystis_antarctica.AAC.3
MLASAPGMSMPDLTPRYMPAQTMAQTDSWKANARKPYCATTARSERDSGATAGGGSLVGVPCERRMLLGVTACSRSGSGRSVARHRCGCPRPANALRAGSMRSAGQSPPRIGLAQRANHMKAAAVRVEGRRKFWEGSM